MTVPQSNPKIAPPTSVRMAAPGSESPVTATYTAKIGARGLQRVLGDERRQARLLALEVLERKILLQVEHEERRHQGRDHREDDELAFVHGEDPVSRNASGSKLPDFVGH